MIDLFSVVFSTTMVLIIIIRAIRRETAADTRREDLSHFRALKDRTNRIERGHTN
jgi:hypothetical protein